MKSFSLDRAPLAGSKDRNLFLLQEISFLTEQLRQLEAEKKTLKQRFEEEKKHLEETYQKSLSEKEKEIEQLKKQLEARSRETLYVNPSGWTLEGISPEGITISQGGKLFFLGRNELFSYDRYLFRIKEIKYHPAMVKLVATEDANVRLYFIPAGASVKKLPEEDSVPLQVPGNGVSGGQVKGSPAPLKPSPSYKMPQGLPEGTKKN